MTLEEREQELKPRLTDEFLETLVEALKVDGWMSDFHETHSFVRNMFNLAEKKIPEDCHPYDDYSEPLSNQELLEQLSN